MNTNERIPWKPRRKRRVPGVRSPIRSPHQPSGKWRQTALLWSAAGARAKNDRAASGAGMRESSPATKAAVQLEGRTAPSSDHEGRHEGGGVN